MGLVSQTLANDRERKETDIKRILPIFARSCVLGSLAFCLSSCFFRVTTFSDEHESYSKYLQNAEEALREKNYDRAIESYEAHILHRLDAEDKASWENPYFYYLLIGDLYLKQGLVDDALASYEFAEARSVDNGLVSDRYRSVASWLSKRDRFTEAVELLNKYRERDELLFDMMRDRIAREKVEKEEDSIK